MKNSPLYIILANINDMTITKKTTFLFSIMIIGMLFIGSFSHMSLNRIRDNFNILYTKRMLPVIKLEKLKDIYSVNILDTLRDMENNLINFKQGEDVILLAQDLIRGDWREYKDSANIDESDWLIKVARSWGIIPKKAKKYDENSDEFLLIGKIDSKIDYIDNILTDMFSLLEKNKNKKANKILQTELYPTVYSANIDLTQLININLEALKQGKEKTDKVYSNTLEWIVAGTIGTISIAALLALVILQNIRFLHEDLARVVGEKTKELQDLNYNLEIKIKEEVEKSRQKDEIMIRQSRHAALGEMIGNIAHQWRQPLNALGLIIQSFQTKRMLGVELSDEFIDAQVQDGLLLANNMSKTIDDFRNFFNPNKQEVLFSVKKSIEKSIEIINSYYKRDKISINLKCLEDFEIMGYPNEFSQVIVNLFSNSKDALNENNPNTKIIEVIIYKNSDNGYIDVVDNGGGIKENVLNRIFEPYFTTKYKASGTGIGLYMSAQIIEKQMKGEIIAENISYSFTDIGIFKKCTKIKICLPLGV